MDAIDDLHQLAKWMRQAQAVLADQHVDQNSTSTFLNVIALGNVGAGKSAVLNSLIGHLILPTGENGATRAPISIDLRRDESLSSKAIILQIDDKSQSVSASDLRHSLQERLSKSGSGKGRDKIYLKLRTNTAPPLKLIDLPGLDQRSMDDSIVSDYAERNDAILLVIIPASQTPEVSSSRALRIAKELDGDARHLEEHSKAVSVSFGKQRLGSVSEAQTHNLKQVTDPIVGGRLAVTPDETSVQAFSPEKTTGGGTVSARISLEKSTGNPQEISTQFVAPQAPQITGDMVPFLEREDLVISAEIRGDSETVKPISADLLREEDGNTVAADRAVVFGPAPVSSPCQVGCGAPFAAEPSEQPEEVRLVGEDVDRAVAGPVFKSGPIPVLLKSGQFGAATEVHDQMGCLVQNLHASELVKVVVAMDESGTSTRDQVVSPWKDALLKHPSPVKDRHSKQAPSRVSNRQSQPPKFLGDYFTGQSFLSSDSPDKRGRRLKGTKQQPTVFRHYNVRPRSLSREREARQKEWERLKQARFSKLEA